MRAKCSSIFACSSVALLSKRVNGETLREELQGGCRGCQVYVSAFASGERFGSLDSVVGRCAGSLHVKLEEGVVLCFGTDRTGMAFLQMACGMAFTESPGESVAMLFTAPGRV